MNAALRAREPCGGPVVFPAAGVPVVVLAEADQRDQAGRAGQIALHHPHLGLFFRIPFVTEIDPEQFGFIHAPRRKEADRQRVQCELNTKVGENRLYAVGDAIVKLFPGFEQTGPFES